MRVARLSGARGLLTPEFTVEAEALVRGIYAIAGRSRRTSHAKSSD